MSTDIIDLTSSSSTSDRGSTTRAPSSMTSTTGTASKDATTTAVITPALSSSIRKKPTTTITPAPPQQRDWLNEFVQGLHCYSLDVVSAKEAKKDYWLSTEDLWDVPFRQFGGGIGIGRPYKCYRHSDLIDKCLQKYSRAEILKKLQARAKRDANKRRKEQAAQEALEQPATATTPAAAAPTVNPKELAKLRASLLKLAKKNLGFEMSGAPKNWRIEVPMMTPATFCALVGRPTDVELKTFVKAGAYYKVDTTASQLFLGDKDAPALFSRNFRREGVSLKIENHVVVRFKPSQNELSVHGGAEIFH